ncbi:MAG: hypothetical protein M3512_11170 [Bacteroidota bacterium]|nr:hypothetical protein [Bacteroidota bacterium]
MKFFDIILISFVVAGSIIGAHQTYYFGLGNSYWIFMLTLVLILWYKIRNNGVSTSASNNELKNKTVGKKERGK